MERHWIKTVKLILAVIFLWVGYTNTVGAYSDQVKYYGNLGIQYSQQGMYDKAIECYTKAIQLDPQLAKSYYNRGNAYANKGMYDAALSDYNKALGLNPNYADVYYNCAIIREKMKMWSAAAANYEEAVKINPSFKNDPEFKARWDRAEREYLRDVASTYGADVDSVLRNYRTVSEWKGSADFSELQRRRGSTTTW